MGWGGMEEEKKIVNERQTWGDSKVGEGRGGEETQKKEKVEKEEKKENMRHRTRQEEKEKTQKKEEKEKMRHRGRLCSDSLEESV